MNKKNIDSRVLDLRIENLGAAKEANVLSSLIAGYEFGDYRNYNISTGPGLNDYITGQVLECFRAKKPVAIARSDSSAVGMCCLSDLPWETSFFGIRMSELKFLMADGVYIRQEEIKRRLLTHILDHCFKEKIGLLACKTDVGDFSSIHALESLGFKLMGAKLSYILNLRNFKIPAFKERCNVRYFKPKDLPRLIDLARHYPPPPSRYQIDPYLSSIKTGNYFVEWTKNACKVSSADSVLIAERNNRIVGFLTYRLNQEMKKFSKLNSLHRGLIIVSPAGKGSALALLKEMIMRERRRLKLDVAQLDVYNYNTSAIRLYQKIGMTLANSSYIFHKHIS